MSLESYSTWRFLLCLMKEEALSLDSILSPSERENFYSSWESFKGKDEPAKAWQVHSGFPVISDVMQFEDKPVFRAKVFQSRSKLRKINPYHNTPYYRIPFWHPIHYLTVAEQMYHASMEYFRKDNHKFVVTEIPSFDLKEKIVWAPRTNGYVSIIGLHKLLAGKWERGRAVESFTCLLVDDKEKKFYGSVSGTCFIGFRSYVKAHKDLMEKKEGSKERMSRLIKDQAEQHNDLLTKRTDLTAQTDELLARVRDDLPIDEKVLHNFFSLYDLNRKVA